MICDFVLFVIVFVFFFCGKDYTVNVLYDLWIQLK